MTAKRLPTDKTIVTEFKIQVADSFTRNNLVKESISSRVTLESGLKQGDLTVTQTASFIIQPVKVMVYIHSYGPFRIRISYGDSAVHEVRCSGLFLFFGELDSVEIHATQDEQLRVSYLYA